MAEAGPFEIRPYRGSDLEAIYRVCLLTGASGQDASELYVDHKLVGHMFAGPYGVLRPQSALVVEDADGVGGYIIGAPDTPTFEAELELAWWPALRAEYPDPVGLRYRGAVALPFDAQLIRAEIPHRNRICLLRDRFQQRPIRFPVSHSFSLFDVHHRAGIFSH